MLTPTPTFVARQVLMFDIDHVTDEQIAAIEAAVHSILSGPTPAAAAPPVHGWIVEVAEKMITGLLARRRPVQTRVLHQMVFDNGTIRREDVYKIGEYADTRSLKGFTRPILNMANQLVDQGLLPEGHGHPIRTVYDTDSASYQQAVGFAIDSAIIPVFRQAFEALGYGASNMPE